MPNAAFQSRNRELLESLETSRQKKRFLVLDGPLGPIAQVEGVGEVIVLCSNNYLGLANHPEVVEAGIKGLEQYGAGTASVRFICGTFACHRDLEARIASFVGAPAALSYVSCWTANEAVFPTLAAPGDVVLSDALNHASIIDSCRLMNKQVVRAVYRHSDLDDLEAKLQHQADKACRWVVTDGVFSMEGDVALLPELIDICQRHDALLVVDDSHGIGALGKTGRGTPEYFDCLGQVDLLTGTLGKALGGAAGGYVAASADAIEVLEQRGRTSLFSNALPATVACSALKAIDILEREPERMARLASNTAALRAGFARLGFDCPDSPTAIIPIMIGDAADAIAKSNRLLELGVMVIGFGYPVVPLGEARLRVQVSAALEPEHIERCLDAFAQL
ncbi:aminotransferase class I/II-fold pyridoxal phosphate-dependent enzyme [Lignipirellula cremea]|uniref:2-amino-3-ketobutyrate coenzyme A ligase n=1 Tax=Lignipirellula cremea TaxID=2528010 RepID=A0A518DY38_9BACT|nr:aminotransferase class I/II-fold pyridoxal phosphate-dependent enzyme [Lignipirellula cremea]QDU96744.1 2-amino-3-ketobutyrate coenzyme A ligase [Lignipirellula cremea]